MEVGHVLVFKIMTLELVEFSRESNSNRKYITMKLYLYTISILCWPHHREKKQAIFLCKYYITRHQVDEVIHYCLLSTKCWYSSIMYVQFRLEKTPTMKNTVFCFRWRQVFIFYFYTIEQYEENWILRLFRWIRFILHTKKFNR